MTEINLNSLEKTEISTMIFNSLYVAKILHKEDFKNVIYFFLQRHDLQNHETFITNFINNSLKSKRKKLVKVDSLYYQLSDITALDIQKNTSNWLICENKNRNSIKQIRHNRLFFMLMLELNLALYQQIKDNQTFTVTINQYWNCGIEPDILLKFNDLNLFIELDTNTRSVTEIKNQIEKYSEPLDNATNSHLFFITDGEQRAESLKNKKYSFNFNAFHSTQNRVFYPVISQLIQSSYLSNQTDLTSDQSKTDELPVLLDLTTNKAVMKQLEMLTRQL